MIFFFLLINYTSIKGGEWEEVIWFKNLGQKVNEFEARKRFFSLSVCLGDDFMEGEMGEIGE